MMPDKAGLYWAKHKNYQYWNIIAKIESCAGICLGEPEGTMHCTAWIMGCENKIVYYLDPSEVEFGDEIIIPKFERIKKDE